MMETKIENQEQFEARIEYFKEKYIKDFKEKINVPGCDKAHVMEIFKRRFLDVRLHEILQSKIIREAYHFRNEKKSLEGIKTFEAVKQFCDEKKPIKDFQFILQSLAEYVAILDIYNELNIDEKENQNQAENMEVQAGNNELYSIIENNLNAFKGEFNNEKYYFEAVDSLKTFFLSGQIYIKEPLFVKSGNIKSMAFALGEIWRNRKNETITYEYLSLYKQLFSIFKNQKIDKKNIFSCNLYKYSISKA
ncbi:MAG TPA: hypothetical protein VMU83_13885 [Hanamia sp.]|nr:hypothetical protein [Hanamia sp.]